MIADLTGRVALVTGGASGIGRGICLVLSAQGADVAVSDVNLEGAEAMSAELSAAGRKSMAVAVDVTSRESIDQMVSGVLARFGQIDVLVNDAGVIGAPGWEDRDTGTPEDWQRSFDVNVRGVVMTSEAVAPHMIGRRYGKIVNIASVAARRGQEVLAHYCASKAAVVSWTQSHALQVAKYGINVNAICPGLLWTPMWEGISRRLSASGPNPELRGLGGRELFERMVDERIPMKREQTPEDIGNLAAFLSSDAAGSITGQSINVDGGNFMN